ncbi:glycine cleavage system protein H [Lactobacillus sp. DCY120]|uniref:Glycine cleavage system protein H n=1 Tax=Bombilactobacillus apium TaxID=2675299 RepID=A0A850R9J8_9LACO|nr:glycine cleavage system protein H [Bombilactobacillus apium]NVY96066.1 glycine cleavage system protein H [Bombilactobacillus apium]
MMGKHVNYLWQEQLANQHQRWGLNAQAQEQLGTVTFVDLRDDLTTVEAGVAFASIEGSKAVLELIAPAAGTVVQVHTELFDQPELVNSPERDQNWFLEIK